MLCGHFQRDINNKLHFYIEFFHQIQTTVINKYSPYATISARQKEMIYRNAYDIIIREVVIKNMIHYAERPLSNTIFDQIQSSDLSTIYKETTQNDKIIS